MNFSKKALLIFFCLCSWGLFFTVNSAPRKATRPRTLYERLGKYDALAAVMDDFLGRLAKDPKFSRFFAPLKDEDIKRVRQLAVDQLCQATGGPCYYVGRDMKTSHEKLHITEEEWNLSVDHLVATLNKFKVPGREKSEVLAAVSGLKKDIVSAPEHPMEMKKPKE